MAIGNKPIQQAWVWGTSKQQKKKQHKLKGKNSVLKQPRQINMRTTLSQSTINFTAIPILVVILYCCYGNTMVACYTNHYKYRYVLCQVDMHTTSSLIRSIVTHHGSSWQVSQLIVPMEPGTCTLYHVNSAMVGRPSEPGVTAQNKENEAITLL